MTNAELQVIRSRCQGSSEKAMSLPPGARDMFDAYHADVSALLTEVDRLRTAVVEAGIVLEVLAGQILVRPYLEMTPGFQGQIVEARDKVRAALGAVG